MTKSWRQADITTPGGQHCPLHIHTKGMKNTNPWEWRSPVSSRFNKVWKPTNNKKRRTSPKTKRTYRRKPVQTKRTRRRQPVQTKRARRQSKKSASRNFYMR